MIFWSIIKLPINLIIELMRYAHKLEHKNRSYIFDMFRTMYKNYKNKK